MRKDSAQVYNVEKLHQMSEEAGYGLTRDEISRIFTRQAARGLMVKTIGGYRLTDAGLRFNSFRKKELK
jgi:hypothetical protein